MEFPRAIVYDAVGTLIHVNPSPAAIYTQVGQRFGSRLNVDEVRRRFYAAFARQEEIDGANGWRTDEARERQRWRDIVAEVLDDVEDLDACFEALWNTFRNGDVWSCEPETAEVIASFRQRGIVQAVASNFDARLHGVVATLPPLHGLNPIVISSQVGWRKPAPQFFAHLIDVLQLPAGDILFVGDDRGNDYDAAVAAGMRALLVDPLGNHIDVSPNRIERLRELIER